MAQIARDSPLIAQTAPDTDLLLSLSPEARNALEHYKQKDNSKIVVRFKATGNAPIMKQNFYKITASNRFQAVIAFLRKELNWPAKDHLFLYINASFAPSPDDTVSSLFKCFAVDKQLIVNYSCLGLKVEAYQVRWTQIVTPGSCYRKAFRHATFRPALGAFGDRL